MDTLAADFDVAHLKTAQQRTLSEQALYARAQSSHDYIAVYRAKLDRAMAQRLFYPFLDCVRPERSVLRARPFSDLRTTR